MKKIYLITCVLILFSACKSNYDSGVELIKDKKYEEAIIKFNKIKTDDENYKKAQKKLLLAEALQKFDDKKWENVLAILSNKSNEMLSEDQNLSDSLCNSSLNEYFKLLKLEGFSTNLTLNSFNTSGFFTKGAEVIFQITNNSLKALIVNYDNIQLLIVSKDGYYLSSPNSNKANIITPEYLAGKEDYAYSIAIKPKSTLKIMLNYDDINESVTTFPSSMFTVRENNSEYLVDYNNKVAYFPIRNDAYLVCGFSHMKLKEPSELKPVENVKNNREIKNDESKEQIMKGKYPYASERNLTNEDVQNMSKNELKIMRNEIFARHGYIFNPGDMNDYFSKQSWYMPKYKDIGSFLTDIEKTNIELIKKYE